jgi:hypothetical protein
MENKKKYILDKVTNVILQFENEQFCEIEDIYTLNLDLRQGDDSSLHLETGYYDSKLKNNFDQKNKVIKVIITYAVAERGTLNPEKIIHVYRIREKESNMEFNILYNDLGHIEFTIWGNFYVE